MIDIIIAIVISMTSLIMLILSISIAYAVYQTYGTDTKIADSDPFREEKLRAYREIMGAIIALNRQVVTMDAETFEEEQNNLAHDRDSKLDNAYQEVNATYESYLHLLNENTREAISDYLDYLATYHHEGTEVGQLLTLGGGVYETMRQDLGLSELYS